MLNMKRLKMVNSSVIPWISAMSRQLSVTTHALAKRLMTSDAGVCVIFELNEIVIVIPEPSEINIKE